MKEVKIMCTECGCGCGAPATKKAKPEKPKK